MTDDIIALIDGSDFSGPVLDLAIWAARRNDAALRLLHVLPPRAAPKADLSGQIKLGARTKLLTELADADAERARLDIAAGRKVLEEAEKTVVAAGITRVSQSLRQGELLANVSALEDGAGLIVIGKRGANAEQAAGERVGQLGSNFERIVRASRLPVLMATRAPLEIARVTIAYDAGPSARRAVERVARLPAYRGLDIEIVTVGGGSDAQTRLDEAQATLLAAGLTSTTKILHGDVEGEILHHLQESRSDFLVMGAYGHSRIRTMVVGSTTTAILEKARVPVLLVR